MRYSEITSLPSSPDEAENSIMDLVAVYQSKDAASIPMAELLSVLHNQGFDANRRWVMDVLKDKQGIERVVKDKVILQQDIPPEGASDDQEQKSAEKVEKMATKAARKSVNNG
jgi:hypothetical protein